MAFSGQRLSFASGPDELLPIGSPTGEPTIVRTIVDGTTVMTATSAGVSITPSGPEVKLSTPVTPAMSPYAVALADVTLLCSTSSAISIVLPTAASSTYRVIQVVDASGGAAANNITVTVSGGGTINGAASYVVNLAYGTATFMSTGAFWVVIDNVASSGGGGGGGYATGVRQIVTSFSGTLQSVTTILPSDNTIPQNTEGSQVYSVNITPQSATSNLLIFATIGAKAPSTSMSPPIALFRDSDVNAFAAQVSAQSSGQSTANTLVTTIASLSTSPTTIRMRTGPSVAGTLFVNGYTGPNTYFGGVAASGLAVIEYGV